MAKNFQYDYPLYCEGIAALVKQIKSSKIEFEYIIGIARGGAVPAIHLSHKLKIPVHIIHWSQYERESKLAFPNDHDSRIGEDLEHGMNILLVDDIIDQGSSIKQLKKRWTNTRFFEQIAMKRLKVASLVYRKDNKAKIKADFYHIEYPGSFVDFFWEK